MEEKREKVLVNENIFRILVIFCSLAPHGASGLKSASITLAQIMLESRSAWSEWIEMLYKVTIFLSSFCLALYRTNIID